MFSGILHAPLGATLWRCANRTGTAGGRRFHATIPAKKRVAGTAAGRSIDPNPWTKTEPFEHVPWRSPSATKGTIRFLGPTKDAKPAFLNFKQSQEHQTNIGPNLERVVDVTDLRHFEPPTTLGCEGIEWVYAPSVLSEDKLLAPDKGDVEAFVRGPYFDECVQLVKDRTGAARSITYNFRHRRIEEAFSPSRSAAYAWLTAAQNTNLLDPYNFSSKPLPNIHIDNDAETAVVNLRRVLGDEEADRWLSKRWGIVNVWRPVGDVVRQWPLALGSCNTVPIRTRNNYKTHFTTLKYSSHLRFYYVSNLAPDEALIFVDFHSAGNGDAPALGMAHGAFEDRGAPTMVPRRRLIEVRCLVLYDD